MIALKGTTIQGPRAWSFQELRSIHTFYFDSLFFLNGGFQLILMSPFVDIGYLLILNDYLTLRYFSIDCLVKGLCLAVQLSFDKSKISLAKLQFDFAAGFYTREFRISCSAIIKGYWLRGMLGMILLLSKCIRVLQSLEIHIYHIVYKYLTRLTNHVTNQKVPIEH